MSNQVTGLLSPWLRKQRINIALPYIKGKVLDFGCGTGELAHYLPVKFYLGVDSDIYSIQIARQNLPQYIFNPTIPKSEMFDTVVLLAVIEHIREPISFLKMLKLKLLPKGKIILTTPHPFFNFVHILGAKAGIFSKEASEEHQLLLNHKKMELVALNSNLSIDEYKHFLFGTNQLFVLS
ncbi:MAG: class I SAM-dependent methyltransferase [Planctomycetes bacterium]|nr:class I SAM-dependent methyltransferase [Planctomycetota bacterium]